MSDAAQPRLCSQCHAWLCHAKDRFCGHCGESLIQAGVSIQPAALYQGQTLPDRITVIITNLEGGLGGSEYLWRDPAGVHPDIPFVALQPDELNVGGQSTELSLAPADLSLDDQIPQQWQLVMRLFDQVEREVGLLQVGLEPPKLSLAVDALVLEQQDTPSVSLEVQHQGGGALLVQELSLDTDQGLHLPLPDIDAELPFSLQDGASQRITLSLSEQLTAILFGRPQGLDLNLCLHSQALGRDLLLPFSLRLARPADPALRLPDKELSAVTGRSLRLPVILENHGGERCKATRLQVHLLSAGHPEVQFDIEHSPAGLVLEPGAEQKLTVPIRLDDPAGGVIPTGLYRLQVSQEFRTEQTSSKKEEDAILQVMALQKYGNRGIIAIDFGTTATAAAHYEWRGSPKPIRLSPDADYIPTAVAYFIDDNGKLDCCIGEQARAKLEQLDSLQVTYCDNIKMQLEQPRPVLMPDNSQRDWVQIATDYLSHIKAMIEDHGDIAASIDEVCVTRPARFSPRSEQALLQAYRNAGLSPRSLIANGQTLNTLSESWPTAALALPIPEIADWQTQAIEELLDSDNPIGSHLLLSYDVGGGSTDLSLLRIDIPKKDDISVQELASFGSAQFCGNAISTLFHRHLWPSCEQWLRDHGADPALFPIRLPWEPVKPGNIERIARDNGRRFAEDLIFPLQWDLNGSFMPLYADLQDIKLWLTPDDELWKGLQSTITDRRLNIDPIIADQTLTLQGSHGPTIDIPVGDTGIQLDLHGFLRDFVNSFSLHMYQPLREMCAKVEGNDRRLLMVLSGRAGRFPLITGMLLTHGDALARDADGISDVILSRVASGPTKTLVSTGGCFIEHLIPAHADDIRFIPLPQPQFGLASGRTASGGRAFVALTSGIPRAEDSPLLHPFPLQGGPQQLQLQFYLKDHGSDAIGDQDPLIGNIRCNLNYPELRAEDAHLIIEVPANGVCDVGIAIPPEQGGRDAPLEQWEHHEYLGELTLAAGDAGQ